MVKLRTVVLSNMLWCVFHLFISIKLRLKFDLTESLVNIKSVYHFMRVLDKIKMRISLLPDPHLSKFQIYRK